MTRDDHLTSTAGEHRAGSLSGIARWLRTVGGVDVYRPFLAGACRLRRYLPVTCYGHCRGWGCCWVWCGRCCLRWPGGSSGSIQPGCVSCRFWWSSWRIWLRRAASRWRACGQTESLTYRDDRLLDNRRRDITAVGVFAAIVLVLAAYVTLLAIPKGVEWWPADWRHHLHWMYPRPVFRPLLLMPIWMCWSMVLAAGMGRARAQSQAGIDPRTVNEVAGDPSQESAGVSGTAGRGTQGPASRLAGQATPAQIFVGFLMAAAFTAIYASRDKNLVIGLGVALVVFLCAYIAAMAAALRWRGQNAVTILATGLAGRTAFVLCWLFVGRALHGW